ncbi:MAG: hypothetical protein LBF34_02770, partial [Puniceicoccales bacterium]|nr:hypothetical protein [Puniceicoccales bacterium]
MNKIFKTYCTTISALASFQVKAIYFNGRDFRPSKATYSSMILGSRYGETYARRMVRLVLPPMQIGKETRNTAGQGKALPNAERPVTLPTSRGNARHRRGSRSALLSQSLTSRSSRKSLAGQGKALPNAERPVTLPTSRGNAPSTGSRSALPQPPPIHTLSVKPPTSGKERKGVAWRRSADPYFVDAPPSSEIWEKATGARALLTQIRDVAAVSRFTSQEMAEIALRKSDFLAATAVLGDQAPMGSPEKNFADLVMRSVKRGILESLPAAMAELEKFSRKSEFQGRQLDWVKFLAGATVQC